MASGFSLCELLPQDVEPPASNYATLNARNTILVLDFDATTSESACFRGVLPSFYAGGGVTIGIAWVAASATANDAVWGASWEEQDANHNDLDSDNFGAESTAAGTANGTSGKVTVTTLTITHADMGSPAAGDPFRLKVRRLPADAGDTMAGDAELLAIHVKET